MAKKKKIEKLFSFLPWYIKIHQDDRYKTITKVQTNKLPSVIIFFFSFLFRLFKKQSNHFSGENSNRFYRIANICKRLGIKFNIAMLFLVDEMYKNVHKTFRVTIGEPIPWQTFDSSKNAAQWAAHVQDIVYQLGKK